MMYTYNGKTVPRLDPGDIVYSVWTRYNRLRRISDHVWDYEKVLGQYVFAMPVWNVIDVYQDENGIDVCTHDRFMPGYADGTPGFTEGIFAKTDEKDEYGWTIQKQVGQITGTFAHQSFWVTGEPSYGCWGTEDDFATLAEAMKFVTYPTPKRKLRLRLKEYLGNYSFNLHAKEGTLPKVYVKH